MCEHAVYWQAVLCHLIPLRPSNQCAVQVVSPQQHCLPSTKTMGLRHQAFDRGVVMPVAPWCRPTPSAQRTQAGDPKMLLLDCGVLLLWIRSWAMMI